MKKIYKEIDSRLQKDKESLINFAKSKGYKFYSEYVYKTLGKKTTAQIKKEIEKYNSEIVPSIQTIQSVKTRVSMFF